MSIQKIDKGWGYELIFANEQRYCGKILHFNTGEKTSMHFHAEKEETFFVLSGEYNIITINTHDASRKTTLLMPGEKMDIPRLLPHQIESISEGDIVEVSTHDDNSDSYRVEGGSSQKSAETGLTHVTSDTKKYQQNEITPSLEGDYELRVSSAVPEQEEVCEKHAELTQATSNINNYQEFPDIEGDYELRVSSAALEQGDATSCIKLDKI